HLVSLEDRLEALEIVGIAEKELGNSVVKRLKTVVELRDILDDAGVSAPLHIFGGLDPLFTPLYFAAGAEIFDGLAWLRYAFHDDLSVHRDSLLILNNQIDKRISNAQFSN